MTSSVMKNTRKSLFAPLEIEDAQAIDLHENEDSDTFAHHRHQEGANGCAHSFIDIHHTTPLHLESFHDNPSLQNENSQSSICRNNGGETSSPNNKLTIYSNCYHHKHIHITSSIIFLIFMTISSTLTFILQLYAIHLTLDMTMRMYFCFPIIFFQAIEHSFALIVTRRFLNNSKQYHKGNVYSNIQQQDESVHMEGHHSPFTIRNSDKSIKWWNVIRIVLEIGTSAFFSVCYFFIVPKVTKILGSLFEDIDGEISSDWYDENQELKYLAIISKTVGILYLMVMSSALLALRFAKRERALQAEDSQSNDNNDEYSYEEEQEQSMGRSYQYYLVSRTFTIMKICHIISITMFSITILILFMSISSAWTFLMNHKIHPGNNVGPNCDPMDTTECMLPFPSSFFTIEDENTITGKRVNIERESNLSQIMYAISIFPLLTQQNS